MKAIEPPKGCVILRSGEIEREDYIWDKAEKCWDLVIGHRSILIGQNVVKGDGCPVARERKKMKFKRVHCSQCGREFPAGDEGYSHCKDHREEPKTTSSTQEESKPDVKRIVASFQENIKNSPYITKRPRARVIGKVTALRELLQEVLEWLYYSDADYSNGVVVHGLDEGRCLAKEAICEMLDKGEALGIMIRPPGLFNIPQMIMQNVSAKMKKKEEI